MTISITIGTYRLPQFAELCVKRCRSVFGDEIPILVSDDASPESPAIRRMAANLNCAYVVGDGRRGHFGGDMQAFLNALTWGETTDICLKLSQRFIPVRHELSESVHRVFSNDRIMVALPGKIEPRQIARSQAKFYGRFGILTDFVGIRTGAITASQLLDVYLSRITKPKEKSDSFSETTWGWLVANTFHNAHAIVPEWTNHRPFHAKWFLRKSQSNSGEYAMVARMEQVKGDWDLREWNQIEREKYMPHPVIS